MMARVTLTVCLVLALVSLWVAAAPLVDRFMGQAVAMADSPGTDTTLVHPEAVDLASVLDFAPFGRAEGSAQPAVAPGEDSGLVLLGITVARSPERSRAILSGGDGPTANYGLGAAIRPDVTLTGIFDDHVTVSWAGRDQDLYFQPGDPGDAPDPVQANLIVATDDTMLARYRAELQQDASGLLARLGLEVTDQGYLVTEAPAEELLQAGLQPGDLIDAVNGSPLGDPDSALTQFDAVAAAGRASLSVTRDGATLLMSYPIP